MKERGYLAFIRVDGNRVFVDRVLSGKSDVLSGKSDYLRKLFNLEDGTPFYA